MTDFLIKRRPYDLSSHAGLALIGKYLKRININALIDPVFPVRSGIANSDILLKSHLGLLCLGKNDFDAIESFRSNAFFMRTLVLQAVPSSPTLRQRLDTLELNRSTYGSHIDLQASCNTTRHVNRAYHSFTQSVPPRCRAFCFSTTETLMKYF